MMREIRRVEPLRLANVLAIVYGAIFVIFDLLVLPVFLMAPMNNHMGQEVPRTAMLGLLVLYPIMGAVMGWLGGLLVAGVYNVVARRLGGVRMEVA